MGYGEPFGGERGLDGKAGSGFVGSDVGGGPDEGDGTGWTREAGGLKDGRRLLRGAGAPAAVAGAGNGPSRGGWGPAGGRRPAESGKEALRSR